MSTSSPNTKACDHPGRNVRESEEPPECVVPGRGKGMPDDLGRIQLAVIQEQCARFCCTWKVMEAGRQINAPDDLSEVGVIAADRTSIDLAG